MLVKVHETVSPAFSVIVAVGLAIDAVDWLAPAGSSVQLMLFNSHAGLVAGSSSLTVYVPAAMSPLLVVAPRASEKSAGAVVLPSQLCSNAKVCVALPVPVLLTTMRAFWSFVYVHVAT